MSDAQQTTYAAAQLRERLGDVDEAHPHAGLVNDGDRRRLLSYLSTVCDGRIEDTEIFQDVVRAEATDALTEAVREGNVSEMQYAVGMVDHSKGGEAAKSRLARELTNEGMVALVLGAPGAGKTALSLDTARIWKSLTGGTVISNVEYWDGTDEVVTTNEEAKAAMQDTNGQVLLLIDEASQSLTGQGAEVKEAETFAKDLKYIRKKGDGDRFAKQGSALIVGHTRKDTAADIRRVASLVAEKPSRSDPGRMTLYESDGGKDSLTEVASYKGISDTPESYREHEASEFTVILDDEDGDDEDVPDPDDVARDEAIKTALRAKLRGDSHPQAAALTDYKDSWVGDRWREWLRGDHRDLVAMPDDPPEHVQDALDRLD